MPDQTTDRSRFAERLEQLLPELRTFARSLCRDASTADDLVQDACLSAWRAASSFDPSQAMRPWLFRILRNEYYMLMRRAWRTVSLDPAVAEYVLVENGAQEALQDFRRMERFIQDLPDAQRDALILVLAAGMTYEEAGELCGTTSGTIKSRVSRAREAVIVRFLSRETLPRVTTDTYEPGMLSRHLEALTGGYRKVA